MQQPANARLPYTSLRPEYVVVRIPGTPVKESAHLPPAHLLYFSFLLSPLPPKYFRSAI